MNSYFILADLASQRSVQRASHSALPDAPVANRRRSRLATIGIRRRRR